MRTIPRSPDPSAAGARRSTRARAIAPLALGLTLIAAGRAPAQTTPHTVKLPAERDTVIMSAHRPNNDGSWGYGWIKVAQGTNRALLGFDLTPVKDFEISGARLVLWVAKNNFRSQANGGSGFSLHPFLPLEPEDQWDEGDDRWDTFSICSQTEWMRVPVQVPGYPGATWNCAADPSTSDGGDTSCGSSFAWDPGNPYLDVLHLGFGAEAGSTIEASNACDYPATDPTGNGPNCDPTCSASINCFKADPTGTDPAECFRRVVVELDADEISRLNENRVDSALECSSFDLESCPHVHPSWLLKRTTESQSNGGGFHYFSREGAICILGDKNPSYSGGYAKLVPTLEVTIDVPSGQQAPADPEPLAHCNQFCEGPVPASGTCSFTGDPNSSGQCNVPYDPNDPQETDCRFPCKQGTCTETQDRCECD